MEIVETLNDAGWGIGMIVAACVVFIILGLMLAVMIDDGDIGTAITCGIYVFLLGLILLIAGIHTCLIGDYYKLKVNKNVTIEQIKQEYKILKYKTEDDIWIVKKERRTR